MASAGDLAERVARLADRAHKAFQRVPARTCAGCGGTFAPVRKDQRNCRPSCRRLAFGRRREQQRSAAPAWQVFE